MSCKHTRTSFAYLHENSGGSVRAVEWCQRCGALRWLNRAQGSDPPRLEPCVWNAPADQIRRRASIRARLRAGLEAFLAELSPEPEL